MSIIDSNNKAIDYEFIDVNQAFEDLTGLKAKNIIGKSVKETIPGIENDKFNWIEFYGEVALGGITKEFEQFSEVLNRWYQVNAYSPEKGYFITIFNEISLLKKIEDRISFTANRYKRIINTSIEGIWEMNENFCTTFVNKQMADMLGYSQQEMMGIRVDSFMFKEDLGEYMNKIEDRRKGLSLTYEWRFKCKNGNPIWTIVSASPIMDLNNPFKGSFAMLTDITNKKNLEAKHRNDEKRLKEAQKIARIGSWSINPKSFTFSWSDELYSIYGLKNTLCKPAFEDQQNYFSSDDWNKFRNSVNKAIADAKPFKIELKLNSTDKTVKNIIVKAETEKDANHKVKRVFGIIQDVTDLL